MHYHRITVSAVVVILFVSSLLLPDGATGQAPTIVWSEPEPLGEHLPASWFPDIHVDQYGDAYLVWESVRDATDPSVTEEDGGALMLSELRDGQWTEPADIYIKDLANAARPILASDDEYLHLISRSPRDEGRIMWQNLSALYYMRAPLSSDVTSARAWSEPVRLTAGPAYWAQLQTLADGTLMLIYNQIIDQEASAAEQRTALFSRRSLDQGATWSRPTRISTTNNRVARSSLAISPIDGTLIVAWDEGYDNLTGQGTPAGIYAAVSTDQGATWNMVGPVGEPDTDGRRVSFSSRGRVEQSTLIATSNTTMLVYRATVEDILLYRLSDDQGRTWTEEQQIPLAIPRRFAGSHHFDKLGIAADGDGRIILTYVGEDSGAPDGLSVFVLTYENGGWSAPSVVASPEGFPEYPRLAVSHGNQVHMVFFVRDEAYSDSGHYVIWTVSGRTTAAELPPADKPAAATDGPSMVTAAPGEPIADAAAFATPIPYPTPPATPAPLGLEFDVDEPASTISRPAVMATAATAGALAIVIVTAVLFRRIRDW